MAKHLLDRDEVKRKRKNPPEALKIFIVAQQNGLCACRDKQDISLQACGCHLLENGNTKVHFNHDPPLELRPWDDDARDFIPGQHDPEYLFAVREDCHKRMTFGKAGGGGRGTDLGDIARTKKILKKREAEKVAQAARDAKAAADPAPLPSGSGARPRGFVQVGSVVPEVAAEAPAGKSRLQGRGFQTNKDSRFKSKVGGGVVRRSRGDEVNLTGLKRRGDRDDGGG